MGKTPETRLKRILYAYLALLLFLFISATMLYLLLDIYGKIRANWEDYISMLLVIGLFSSFIGGMHFLTRFMKLIAGPTYDRGRRNALNQSRRVIPLNKGGRHYTDIFMDSLKPLIPQVVGMSSTSALPSQVMLPTAPERVVVRNEDIPSDALSGELILSRVRVYFVAGMEEDVLETTFREFWEAAWRRHQRAEKIGKEWNQVFSEKYFCETRRPRMSRPKYRSCMFLAEYLGIIANRRGGKTGEPLVSVRAALQIARFTIKPDFEVVH